MASWNQNENPNNLRVIKTARDEDSINKAAKSGFRPLVKKIVRSKQVHSKYAVFLGSTTMTLRSGLFLRASSRRLYKIG